MSRLLRYYYRNSYSNSFLKFKIINTCIRFKYYIAIIGSGPSGFYCSKYLLEKNNDIHIDMYEKLPMPFGLVRYGVAPDHPEVKSVTHTFHEVGNNKRFRYFGNVSIGQSHNSNFLPFDNILKNYSAVVLSYGASEDMTIGIENEDLSNVISARQLVNWYNSHSDFRNLNDSIRLNQVKDVVIIGNGNVAIDCARILLKDPEKELSQTDISSNALAILRSSNIRSVTILGRRGHIQASFTIKELRELSKMTNVHINIDKNELLECLNESSKLELSETISKHRLVDLINKLSNIDKIDIHNKKIVNFKFLCSPIKIHSDSNKALIGLSVCKNKLIGEKFNQTVVHTDTKEYLPCQLLIKSIGYRSIPIDGIDFDYNNHIIKNNNGKTNHKSVYVSGWLKRGPSGIIGTNIPDAKETVDSILKDLNSNTLNCTKSDPINNIPIIKDNKTIISWNDYLLLDKIEIERGQNTSPKKSREKLQDLKELIELLDNNRKS